MAPFGSAVRRRLRETLISLFRPALAGLALASIASGALAQERLALILTSGAPERTGMTEAVATELEQGLESHGFDVIRRDGSQWSGLISALALFEKAMEETETALVIYAGETAVWEGRTFMMPAQSSLEKANDILRRATMLNFAIETAGQARLQSGVMMLVSDSPDRPPVPGISFGAAELAPWLINEDAPSRPTIALSPPSDTSAALDRLLVSLRDPNAGIASLAVAVSGDDAERRYNLQTSTPFAGAATAPDPAQEPVEEAPEEPGYTMLSATETAAEPETLGGQDVAEEVQTLAEPIVAPSQSMLDADALSDQANLSEPTSTVSETNDQVTLETVDRPALLITEEPPAHTPATPADPVAEDQPFQGLTMSRPDSLSGATTLDAVEEVEEVEKEPELSERERERIERRQLEETLSLAERRQIEAALDGLGVFFGVVDGEFDALTRSAIRQLQILNDTEPVGYLSASEIKRLQQ